MSSNVFSRLLQSGRGRSFYEELRTRDDDAYPDDHAGLLDEENLNHQFQDYDLEHAVGLGVDDSRATLEGARPLAAASARPNANGRWPSADDDIDNDVPASLLVEPHDRGALRQPGARSERYRSDPTQAAPPETLRAQWETAQRQQRLHRDDGFSAARPRDGINAFMAGASLGSAKKKAEWRWANVSNLDNFTRDIYDYYQGFGIWCILLERALHLLYVS